MSSSSHGGNVWDRTCASGGYEKQPDEEFLRLCRPLEAGRALDVGAEEGRHSLWLAAHGWSVDAVDVSQQGIANLQQQARRHGLAVNAWTASADQQVFEAEAYDLVISTGAALNFFRKAVALQIIDQLKQAVLAATE